MRIVKLALPLETSAKSLFKSTVGNDLSFVARRCKFVKIFPKNISDVFVKEKQH